MPEQALEAATASGGPAPAQAGTPEAASQAPAQAQAGAAPAAPAQAGTPGEGGTGDNDATRVVYWQRRWTQRDKEYKELLETLGGEPAAAAQAEQPAEEDLFGSEGEQAPALGAEAAASAQQVVQPAAPVAQPRTFGEARTVALGRIQNMDAWRQSGQIPPGWTRPVSQEDVNGVAVHAKAWLADQAERFYASAQQTRQERSRPASLSADQVQRMIQDGLNHSQRLSAALRYADTHIGNTYLDGTVVIDNVPTPRREAMRTLMETSRSYDPELALMILDRPGYRAELAARAVRESQEAETQRQAAAQPGAGHLVVSPETGRGDVASQIIELGGLATAPRGAPL